MKNTFRLSKTQRKNDEYFSHPHDGCFLCERTGKNFVYWKIVKNFFPYDRIASEHDLLVPKRHIGKEIDLSNKELKELMHIKSNIISKTNYDAIMETLPHKQSSRDHYHLHLIKMK